MGFIKNTIQKFKDWKANREVREQEKQLLEIEKAKVEMEYLKTQKAGLVIINQRDKLKEEIRKLKTKPDRFSISKIDSDIKNKYNSLEETAGKKELPKIL